MRQGDHEIIQSVAEWAESRLLKKAAMSRFGSIDPVGRVPAWTSRRWEHKWSRSREERSAAGSNSSPSTTELDIRGGASKQVRLNLETEVKTNSVWCWIEVTTSWGVSHYIILFCDKHMYVRTSTDSHLYVHYERLEVAIQTSPPTNGRQASSKGAAGGRGTVSGRIEIGSSTWGWTTPAASW